MRATLNVLNAAFRATSICFVVCGLLYPLALTALGQLLLPFQANGSLERSAAGAVLGSRLIGQQWTGPEWFHGRPSATSALDLAPAPYNAASSAGSNLGPTSRSLKERLIADRRALERAQPELVGKLLPADVLTASGSGLDPDISPASASLQVVRIARARAVNAAEIEALIRRHVTDRSLGLFGEPRVNVLALNLALERACALKAMRDCQAAHGRTGSRGLYPDGSGDLHFSAGAPSGKDTLEYPRTRTARAGAPDQSIPGSRQGGKPGKVGGVHVQDSGHSADF